MRVIINRFAYDIITCVRAVTAELNVAVRKSDA
jgi:hypothetical protein